ncbi:MAG: Fe-S cluster assembly protein IscX [Alphaproteobacteria bacterium]|nr:Fe-S cluster assembly protein IscX [Alphaproteobacteria bacterium]
MALKWSDTEDLAQALAQLYPDVDLSVLEHDELREMVAGIEGFDDPTEPDEDDMEAVIVTWIDILYPEEDEHVKSGDID